MWFGIADGKIWCLREEEGEVWCLRKMRGMGRDESGLIFGEEKREILCLGNRTKGLVFGKEKREV